MFTALGPGKFYGSSLPRPRFYTDVKLNDHRVDPPLSAIGPLLSWAEEAHWSMGGLSFKRHRLQGRIEGNVERLRSQREQSFNSSPKPKKSVSKTLTPPPVAIKRRRVVGLIDDDEDENVRKLGVNFERVAKESGMDFVAARTRSKKLEAVADPLKDESGPTPPENSNMKE